jgi:hypothetical protein
MKSGCLLIDWIENRSARLHRCHRRRRLFVLFSPCAFCVRKMHTLSCCRRWRGKEGNFCVVRAARLRDGKIVIGKWNLGVFMCTCSLWRSALSLLNKQQAKDARAAPASASQRRRGGAGENNNAATAIMEKC